LIYYYYYCCCCCCCCCYLLLLTCLVLLIIDIIRLLHCKVSLFEACLIHLPAGWLYLIMVAITDYEITCVSRTLLTIGSVKYNIIIMHQLSLQTFKEQSQIQLTWTRLCRHHGCKDRRIHQALVLLSLSKSA